jgi:hypothetical protein
MNKAIACGHNKPRGTTHSINIEAIVELVPPITKPNNVFYELSQIGY